MVVFFSALINLPLLRRHFEIYALVNLFWQEWQCLFFFDPEAVRLDQDRSCQISEYWSPRVVFFDELRWNGALPIQFAHYGDHPRIVTGTRNGKFSHQRAIGFCPQDSITEEIETAWHRSVGARVRAYQEVCDAPRPSRPALRSFSLVWPVGS